MTVTSSGRARRMPFPLWPYFCFNSTCLHDVTTAQQKHKYQAETTLASWNKLDGQVPVRMVPGAQCIFLFLCKWQTMNESSRERKKQGSENKEFMDDIYEHIHTFNFPVLLTLNLNLWSASFFLLQLPALVLKSRCFLLCWYSQSLLHAFYYAAIPQLMASNNATTNFISRTDVVFV